MEYRITQTGYDKIKYLAQCAISAYSKKDALPKSERIRLAHENI